MNLKKLLFDLIKLLLTPIKILFYLNYILIYLTTNYYIRRTFILNESDYKIRLIKNIAKFYNYESFIETGTYLGRTSYGVRKIFKSILTTELNKFNFPKIKYVSGLIPFSILSAFAKNSSAKSYFFNSKRQ